MFSKGSAIDFLQNKTFLLYLFLSSLFLGINKMIALYLNHLTFELLNLKKKQLF